MAVESTPPLDELELINPYRELQKSEGLPVYTGIAIEDLNAVELGPGARKGGRARTSTRMAQAARWTHSSMSFPGRCGGRHVSPRGKLLSIESAVCGALHEGRIHQVRQVNV